MIRIKIELVPDGINSLQTEQERIVLGCLFPLDSKNQRLQAAGERYLNYAEIEGVNLDELLYDPPDGKPDYLRLAKLAIDALIEQKTYRKGGEMYPGMWAYAPEEFAKVALDLIGMKDVIRLVQFGRRVDEEISDSNFKKDLTVYAAGVDRVDGAWLLKNYSRYIPRQVCVTLDPALYRSRPVKTEGLGTYPNRGVYLETLLQVSYYAVDHPHIRKMKCFGGLVMFFARPDGTISAPAVGANTSSGKSVSWELGTVKYSYTAGELRRLVRSGKVLFDRGAITAR